MQATAAPSFCTASREGSCTRLGKELPARRPSSSRIRASRVLPSDLLSGSTPILFGQRPTCRFRVARSTRPAHFQAPPLLSFSECSSPRAVSLLCRRLSTYFTLGCEDANPGKSGGGGGSSLGSSRSRPCAHLRAVAKQLNGGDEALGVCRRSVCQTEYRNHPGRSGAQRRASRLCACCHRKPRVLALSNRVVLLKRSSQQRRCRQSRSRRLRPASLQISSHGLGNRWPCRPSGIGRVRTPR